MYSYCLFLAERNVKVDLSFNLFRPKLRKRKAFKKLLMMLILFFAIYTGYFIFKTKALSLAGLYSAFKKALAVYLSYALFLEMEPDYIGGRLIPTALCGAVLIFFPSVSLGFLLLTLALTRFMTMSSGLSPTVSDYALIGFLALVMFFRGSYIFMLYVTVIMIYDFASGSHRLLSLVLGLLSMGIAALNFFKMYFVAPVKGSLIEAAVLTGIVILYLFRLSFVKRVLTTDDTGLKFISPGRLRASNLFMCIFIIIYYINFADMGTLSVLLVPMGFSVFPFIDDIIRKEHADS